MTPENWEYLERVWEQLGFWASSLIFVTASADVPKLVGGLRPSDIWLSLIVVAAGALRGEMSFRMAQSLGLALAQLFVGEPPDAAVEFKPEHREAIEELLRFEPPAPHMARYVTRDFTAYDQTVPEGSVMLMLVGAACRDERQFGPDAGEFNIHRTARPHLTFSVGAHFCLGSALARMQTRVALEEVIQRWPEWEVDYANAGKAHTSSVRGWSTLPVLTG